MCIDSPLVVAGLAVRLSDAVTGLPALLTAASQASTAGGSGHDLSAWGMFLMADWVVRSVMLGLVLASVLTWTIGLVKGLELARDRRYKRQALRRLCESDELARVDGDGDGVLELMLRAAESERAQSRGLAAAGIRERLAGRLTRIRDDQVRRARRAVGILASIGSTAPFVGLFGTVWGIMNSFIGIAGARSTNLAVVAPGIAEALLATALGLVAAIPAVLLYNQFARRITDYRAGLDAMAGEILRLASLELDRQAAARRPVAA